MNRLTFFTNCKVRCRTSVPAGGGSCRGSLRWPCAIPETKPDHLTLVAAGLKDPGQLLGLKEWIKSRPKDGKVIFVTDANSRIETTRAFAIGATDVVHRPIDGRALLRKHAPEVPQGNGTAAPAPEFTAPECPGAAEATGGLQSMFSAVALGEPIETTRIEAAAAAVVDEIEAKGFSAWIDAVRRHHSQTYQHCLLVTGAAVAFAGHLRLSMNDRNRLSFAAMLHDVGKAQIPVAILEKPGPLDEAEMAIMRKHPEYGYEALKSSPDCSPK